ncbi:5-oxoprolinase subunit PxpB [Polaribacter sp.]|uniref:5-oxoprolinase subunit PxpB n=1 Tax=Polaribacter sp. TaxID=1920175 RepID=UPI003F6CF3D0
MGKQLTYKRFGEKAILIEWESKIDDTILNDIILFKEKIIAEKRIDFVDVIQGYHSLTIVFSHHIINFKKEIQLLQSIYSSTSNKIEQKFHLWQIPVCYDLEFGIDLKEIAQQKNSTVDEIIKLHSEVVYKIYFIGFLPGFLYLGGLPEQLFVDRKANPRLHVAKGSVGIGGMQTGVYPNNSAGGWNIIGKTPVNFFNVEKKHPCFAKAGDCIKFNPISLPEFYRIEKEINAKQYQIKKLTQNA